MNTTLNENKNKRHAQDSGTRTISRSLLNEMRDNLMLVKAVAMSIYVKNHVKNSTVKKFSINRLHILTRLHSNTIDKYLEVLEVHELIRYEGCNLIFSTLGNGRDTKLPPTKECSVKELEDMLLAMLIVEKIKQKEFVRRTIKTAHDPKYTPDALEECKKARRICRDRHYGNEYNEYGLSYKTIAHNLGISLQKTLQVVDYAVKKGIIKKEKRQDQLYIKGIKKGEKFINCEESTFCTKNNMYKIYANIYSLPPTG